MTPIEVQRIDDDARVVAVCCAHEVCCFVERADAGPGDEFEVDRQSELPRQAAQLGEEIPDVPQIVAPGAAQNMLAAELCRGIDVAGILRRLPAGPLSIEIPNTTKLASLGAEQ